MTISLTCQQCRASFRVKDEHAGRSRQCPKCRAAVAVPTPRPAPDTDSRAILQEVLDAFGDDIPRVRVTLPYRVGILLVTAMILLLPILYLALIGGVVALLYYHATVNLAMVQRARSFWVLLFGYVGPLLAGAILVFFMLKPLFARRARAAPLRSLEFGQEPVLFAFVTRVARAVRAPEPKRIDVDCQVNASAGFGSGLLGLFGQDLVLTLGLPLVAGLDANQLAGVLAHELGHFSQGAGMRLTYLVRSVNGWFARVVYERDDWDEALVAWSQESGRLTPIFLLARLCVWLSRGVLGVFMLVSHALSCFLSRQMEYDADRYQARVAGSAGFPTTFRRVALLSAASDGACGLLTQGCLPDDLTALVVGVAERVPTKQRRRLQKHLDGSRTGLFDTHPALPDRVANVRRENAPGIFHLDWPAARLFSNFPRLARDVTFAFYRGVFGRRIRRDSLVPVATLLPEEPESSVEPEA